RRYADCRGLATPWGRLGRREHRRPGRSPGEPGKRRGSARLHSTLGNVVLESPAYRDTFARLLGFLRPYRASLVVSIVLAVASQGAQIALIWVTKHVIDGALRPHDSHKLWVFVAAIVMLGVARAVLMAARRLISGRQA